MTQRKTNFILIGLATLGVLLVIAVAGVALQARDLTGAAAGGAAPNDRANHQPLHPNG